MQVEELSPRVSLLTRFSPTTSSTSKRYSVASDTWPSSPLLPHTPTTDAFPRSSSGQSIPIFFRPEDVVGGAVDGGDSESDAEQETSFGRDLKPLDATRLRQHLESDQLSSHSSSASSRCLSIDSSSAASDSTAPTEPPSPSPLSPRNLEAECSPPTFTVPLPLPSPHVRTSSHHPLLNARRKISARPGTAPSATTSPPRQRSVSYSPAPTTTRTPRAYHSHHCVQRRSPPRSAPVPPPADAFFDPFSPSRPGTGSSFGSVKAIPIRLVPPTPTDAERALKLRQRRIHHAPSSPMLTNREARTKPLPSLPIFPTRPRTGTTEEVTRRVSPPPTALPPTHARNRSRSEGVYNVPAFPPCVYPPSPPRPARTTPRSSPRSVLPRKFSFRTLKNDDDDEYAQLESIPLIARGSDDPSTASLDLQRSIATSVEGARFVQGESTLQLLIDQEGFRDAKIEFVYTGEDSETGLLEFVARRPEAGLEREGWPFHVGFLQTSPHLRRLHLNDNHTIDYLSREASLAIGTKNGVYKVSSHSKIDLELAKGGQEIVGPYFCFAYETNERLNLVGRPMKGERLLRPLVFVCSREFLNPSQGRKIGFKHLLSRTFALPTSSALVVRKQKSVSALKLESEQRRAKGK